MKYYCYLDREGKFNATKNYIEDNPFAMIDFGMIEAVNVLEAENKCKNILRERFNKL